MAERDDILDLPEVDPDSYPEQPGESGGMIDIPGQERDTRALSDLPTEPSYKHSDNADLPVGMATVGENVQQHTRILKSAGPLRGWLVGVNTILRGRDWRLGEGKITIGSGPRCDIVFKDPFVSAEHASIRADEEGLFITDLDSTNGTFVNDKQIDKFKLNDYDEITVGEIKLRVKIY